MPSCRACDAAIDEGDPFCASCGEEVEDADDDGDDEAEDGDASSAPAGYPPGRPSPATGASRATTAPMAVCTACGVIAPREHGKCSACKAPLQRGAQPTAPPRADGRYWVRVSARFQCRQCGRRSPLGHLDADGTIVCLLCGLEQAGDPSVWRKGLRYCHAVGDLSGPDPEGRISGPVSIADQNKQATIGVSRASGSFELAETVIGGGGVQTKSLFLEVSPGVPLCQACRRPLDVEAHPGGRLTTSCAGCSDQADYALERRALGLHRGLVGALADDHRTDRADAKLNAPAGTAAVELQCPRCGASLPLSAKDHFVTCKFCGTSAKVPSRTRAQLFHGDADADPFWLLFEGPSPDRQKLVSKAEKRARHEAAQRERAAEKRQQGLARAASASQSNRSSREAATKSSIFTRKTKDGLPIAPYLLGGVMLAIFLPAWYFNQWRPMKEREEAAAARRASPPPSPQPVARRAPAAAPLPDRAAHTPVRECTCKLPQAAGRPATDVTLAMKPDLGGKMQMGGVTRLFVKASYFLDVGSQSFRLSPTAHDAPPTSFEGIQLDLAVGCGKDIVAIVGPTAATGWSTKDGARVWSTNLPGGPTPRLGEADLVVSCHRNVVAGGVMSLPTRPGLVGAPLRIRLSDGKVL